MKKIIHLNENDIYRIVKRIISEENGVKTYAIKGSTEDALLTIKDGYLYGVAYNDKSKTRVPVVNLNGVVDEFKVQVFKTGEKDLNGRPMYGGSILDQRFIDNNQSLKKGGVGETDEEDGIWGIAGGYFNQLMSGFKPMQTKTKFAFFGITPEGKANAGIPRVYTANIVVLPLDQMDARKKTPTTEKNVVSHTTYQVLGKFGKKKNLGVTIELYPAANPAVVYGLKGDTNTPRRINVNLTVTDPFKFDKTDFYPETEDTLENFINEVNGHINNPEYGQQFRDFLSQNPINVFAYASIDADSKEISQGRLPSCQDATQTKEQYNLCLSQARADKVKEYLEGQIQGITIVAKGEGETDKFAPGKKFPDATPEETKPNRAVVIRIPEFTTRID